MTTASNLNRRSYFAVHQMPAEHQSPAVRRIKMVILLYLYLIIFEGALRKWILPQLSDALLIIRDPVAIAILYMAARRGLLPRKPELYLSILLGAVGIYTAIAFGHGNLVVAVYGARPFLLHFPLIFVIGRVFDREDVIAFGRQILIISIPMALLIALQFSSPQDAWVNRGVGGSAEGGGFSGALGFFRPPGTFSFTSGVTGFFDLQACFVIFFWLHPALVKKAVLYAATAALIAAIPLSISRGLFFQIGVSLLFTMAVIATRPAVAKSLFYVMTIGVVIALAVGQLPIFDQAVSAFTSRFATANETEGGVQGVLLDRYLGGLFGALLSSNDQPFWGQGMGLGTNVGSKLLFDVVEFQLSEGEWGRLIGEMGPLLGITAVLMRTGFIGMAALRAFGRIRAGDLLPWILISVAVTSVPQAQWSQPTALGFSVAIGGLMLASFRRRMPFYDRSSAPSR